LLLAGEARNGSNRLRGAAERGKRGESDMVCVLAFNVKGKWEKRNCYSEWKMGVEGAVLTWG